MKLRTRISSLLAITVLGLILSNCKDDGNSTPKAKIELKKLSKTWTLISAKLGGGDELVGEPTAEGGFNGVTLTISGTYSSAADATYNYEVDGTLPDPSPWPLPGATDGEWAFVSAENGLIMRDPNSEADKLSMNYTIINDQLTIQFYIQSNSTGWPGSKTSGVSGQWEFIFE